MKGTRYMSPSERLALRTERQGDCLVWTGALVGNGYAQFSVDGRHTYVHRWAWEALNGPIPEGLELDHLCRNRACVEPNHLEPVTARENQLRSPFFNGHKTACPKGHPYSQQNTYVNPKGSRVCRTCRKAAIAASRARRRTAA